jgi:hypothetical protein
MADKKKLAKYRKKLAAIEYPWQMVEVSQDDREKAAVIDGLRTAMLGTTDGGFIDPDSDIPAGEMFRLAAEYVESVWRPGGAPVTENEVSCG